MASKKNKRIVEKLEDKYMSISEKDTIIWIRSVLQSLDLAYDPKLGIKISLGQAIERFLFTRADIVAKKRVDQALIDLNKRIDTIEVSSRLINKDIEKYTILFMRFINMVGGQPYLKLRKAYVNQLASLIDKKYSDDENKMFYQQILFKINDDQLAILTFAERYLGSDSGEIHENSKKLESEIQKRFSKKGLEQPLIRGLVTDLLSMGLLKSTQSSVWGGDLHRLYLSSLGRKILEQIKWR